MWGILGAFRTRFRELGAARRVRRAVQRITLDRRLCDQGLGWRLEFDEAKRAARFLPNRNDLYPGNGRNM